MAKTTQELFDLTGKVSIVTGAAGWLGSAMTQALAEAGSTVAAIDIDKHSIEKLQQLASQQNLNIKGYVADTITDENQMRNVIDTIAADLGRIDILINCAVKGYYDEIDNITSEHFEQSYKSSIAYFVLAQQAVKHMKKTGAGSIINIASMYALITGYPHIYQGLTPPNPLPYQADKAAVLQMTRHTAVYWAKDNIRVNAISPGPFPNTNKSAYANNPKTDEFINRLTEMIPLKRIGKPEEIKGAAIFLASDASTFITGQNFIIDGGSTIW